MKRKELSNITKVEVIPPPGKARSLPLTTVGHCRGELAAVYRMAKNGEMDYSDATKLTYILIALGKMIVDHDLESRIAALEEKK